jgi:hypothetical protein
MHDDPLKNFDTKIPTPVRAKTTVGVVEMLLFYLSFVGKYRIRLV